MKRAKKRVSKKRALNKPEMEASEIEPTPTPPPAPEGLVGRYFNIFADDGNVQFQGRVESRLDDTHYLIQLYEIGLGIPSGLHVVTIEMMTAPDLKTAGCWHFYVNEQHFLDWCDEHPYREPRDEMAQSAHTGNGGNPAPQPETAAQQE